MRLLRAALTAALVLALIALLGMHLFADYERRQQAATAVVSLDALGQIRIDGQPIGLEQFRGLWGDPRFRSRHCDRWQLEAHPEAPAPRHRQVAALMRC